jgi:hypothetical protein
MNPQAARHHEERVSRTDPEDRNFSRVSGESNGYLSNEVKNGKDKKALWHFPHLEVKCKNVMDRITGQQCAGAERRTGNALMKKSGEAKRRRVYPPHIPRLGAPQGQGPGSAAAASREPPETAKTESSLSTCELEHFAQVIFVEPFETIFSNLVPHSRQRYSKMGMGRFSPGNRES